MVGLSLIVDFAPSGYALYMITNFSIVHDMPAIRSDSVKLPNKVPVTWTAMVKMMRAIWEAGQDTQLRTAYYQLLNSENSINYQRGNAPYALAKGHRQPSPRNV